MEYCFKEFSISAPFATTSLGHLCQTFPITEHKDDIKCRIFSFRNENQWIMHLSIDILASTLEIRNTIQDTIRKHYNNNNINVILSTTHTHYSHNPLDPHYQQYASNIIFNEIFSMEYSEMGEINTDYIVENKKVIGKSRITGYESNNEYLGLLRFYTEKKNFLTVVLYNCHPTTLANDTPFFSAEYPGYVLSKLKQAHPETDFTFMQGAAGDISTRFTRSGQQYEDMCELGEILFNEIEEFSKQSSTKTTLSLDYQEQDMHYEHEFTPLDPSRLPKNATKREIESFQGGQIIRAKQAELGACPVHQVIARWNLGSVKLILFPNEIFSSYLDYIDIHNSYLVSYSNGYGPYVTPIDFPFLTYEVFIDTTTKNTKEMIIDKIKNIQPMLDVFFISLFDCVSNHALGIL